MVGRFDESSDHSTMVEAVLAKVSEDQREALTMKYVIGMSSHEIAAVLGRSSTAVDSLLQRGREAFAGEWNLLTREEVQR